MLTETEVKGMFKDLAVDMLKKVNQYKDISDKLKGINLFDGKQNDDEKLAKALIKTENEFLEVYSRLPFIDRHGEIHYPIVTDDKENIVTEEFLDKVIDAINGKEDKLDGENFATVLLGNAKFNNIPNVKYAVPQCIKGDITNATTFLCLLNPGSDEIDRVADDNFYSYYSLPTSKLNHKSIYKDGSIDLYFLIKYMNDIFDNIVYSEFSFIKEDLVNEILKIKNDSIAISDKNLTIETQQLSELKKMDEETLSKELDELRNEKSLIDVSYLISSRAYYTSQFYATYLDKSILSLKKEFLSSIVSSIGENYDERSVREKVELEIEKLKYLNICNLELVPLRSNNSKGINSYMQTHFNLSVMVILRRICLSEFEPDNISKPIFVFRHYCSKDGQDKGWRILIKNILKSIFTDKEVNEIIRYIELKYFLYFPYTSSALSTNNPRTIADGDSEGYRINELDKIQNDSQKELLNRAAKIISPDYKDRF